MTSTLRAVCAAVLLAASVPVALAAPDEPGRSLGTVVDDTVITTRIKASLAQDPVARATQVNVETRAGVVQLSGFAESQEVADRAVELAREVPGVSAVHNDIRVRSGS